MFYILGFAKGKLFQLSTESPIADFPSKEQKGPMTAYAVIGLF